MDAMYYRIRKGACNCSGKHKQQAHVDARMAGTKSSCGCVVHTLKVRRY